MMLKACLWTRTTVLFAALLPLTAPASFAHLTYATIVDNTMTATGGGTFSVFGSFSLNTGGTSTTAPLAATGDPAPSGEPLADSATRESVATAR